MRRIPVDPDLRAKVRASVESHRRRPSFPWPLLWLLLVLLPPLLLWMDGPSRDLLQRAADEHAACAVAGIVPVEPMDSALLRAQVARQLPDGYRILNAHRCRRAKRWFTHLVLARGEARISLLISDLRDKDALLSQWAVPAPRGRYLVSAQPLDHHAIFLVSDLSMDQHGSLATALDPSSLLVSPRASLPMRFLREKHCIAD